MKIIMSKKYMVALLWVFSYCINILTASITIRTKKHDRSTERVLDEAEHGRIKKLYKSIGIMTDSVGGETIKPLFNTAFLKNPHEVAVFLENPPVEARHCKAEKRTVVCDGNHTAHLYFLDRKSDVLVVAAPGLGFGKEMMASFAEILPQYDLLLIEHRGHGLHAAPHTVTDQAVYACLNIVPSLITLGRKEVDDINTIVTKNKKERHTKVVALGFCYSSLLFSAAQKKYPALFTHAIFDGPIISIAHALRLMQQKKAIAFEVFPLLRRYAIMPGFDALVKKGIDSLLVTVQGISLKNDEQCAALKIPLLLWHGKQDPLISEADFDLLWKSLSNEYSCAVLTQNRHLVNFLKEKEFYRWSIEAFLKQEL